MTVLPSLPTLSAGGDSESLFEALICEARMYSSVQSSMAKKVERGCGPGRLKRSVAVICG